MNILLFGGAFDPIHLGHQRVVSEVLDQEIADEVWYVPVKNHHFDKHMASPHHRVEMLKLILIPKTRVEEWELNKPGNEVNFTFDTLKELRAKYPDHRFSWLIGADNLKDFHKWGDVESMLSQFVFYVYPRQGCEMKPLYKQMIALNDLPEIDVSSTQVRESLKRHDLITKLVDPKVDEYIKNNQLYS